MPVCLSVRLEETQIHLHMATTRLKAETLPPDQINSVDKCPVAGDWAKQACHFKDFLFILMKYQDFHEELSELYMYNQSGN